MTTVYFTKHPWPIRGYIVRLQGIIHNHSACSKEGCYPLKVLRERWAHKLDFAAMTEHAERTTAEAYLEYVQSCDALSDERFRFIPGLEVATTCGDMLLLGCRKFICSTDPFEVLQAAYEIHEARGCVVLLAHPEQGKMSADVLRRIDGFESWNSGHMGSFMPPLDWFLDWRRRYAPDKIMTGGNDIHKIDPKRKILTFVESETLNETALLDAIRQGRFVTSNGIFTITASGHAFFHRGASSYILVTGNRLFVALAYVYRTGWQAINAIFECGSAALTALGVDKIMRTRLNRLLRQYL